MQGQRIYYVPPRMVGTLTEWSGMDAPDGASWLVDHAADLGFNAIWFSPLTVTSDIEKKVHDSDKILGHSYYAARDHFHIDPEFSTGDAEKDRAHLRHFCAAAKAKGVSVYADLVFNHVAVDHPLVTQENAEIAALKAKAGNALSVLKSDSGKVIGLSYKDGANDNAGEEKKFYFKFRRTEKLDLLFGGPPEDPWTDVAQINYSSPEARRYFVTGDETHKGLFKQAIDWHIDNGFTNFRCDAAYLIPPESWQELVSYAHSRVPDTVFMAETLSLDHAKVKRMAKATIKDDAGKDRPAFDLGMLGFYWWNFKDDWMPKDEMPRVQSMAKFGGAGSPDTHDTDYTLAGSLAKAFNKSAATDKALADISIRNYALSALCCNSHYTQMGFEYCNTKQNGVFKGQVSPADWQALESKAKGTVLDISDRMRAINKLKDDMDLGNCRATFKEYGFAQNDTLIRIRAEFTDVDTNQKRAEVVLVMNRKPEKGPVTITDPALLALQTSGLSRLGLESEATIVNDVQIYHTPLAPQAPAAKPAVKRAANGPKI